MLTDRDIVFVSAIDWDDLWQGRQEVASRLARAGNRVLYVENTGVRSPRLIDRARVASRLENWLGARRWRGARRVTPNLYLSSPLVLPPFGSRSRRALNRRVLLPAVARTAAELGMRDPILWTYLPTDTVLDLIDLLRTPRSTVIYSCIADFAQLTTHPQRLREAEQTLIESSDVVFAQGRGLFQHCDQWSSKVHRIECAVSLERFSPDGSVNNARLASGDGIEPDPLEGLPRPIIGYVGGLHRYIDLRLAVDLARARPTWSWVYVGSVQAPMGELAALPNVHLVGRVSHADLPRFIGGFDVCTVPYTLVPETDTVFPTKLVEYLAMGKPVVATALPEVRDFNARHPVLATPSSEPRAFLDAIEKALAPERDGQRETRRAVAATCDYQAQLERMSDLIEASGAAA